MKLNFRKLSIRIIEDFGTQSLFAERMGLSERSLSLKLNSKREFKTSEILKACDLLDIPREDIPSYFFCIVS